MPGNPLIYYILCDRELFVGDVFMYPRQVPLPMIMSVALLKTLLSSLLKIVYIVFDVSGKELYSKPTISLICRPWCDHVAFLLCTGKVISVASGTSHVIMGWKRHVIMGWTRSF